MMRPICSARQLLFSLTAAVTIALAAAGCGDSGDASTGALTKAQFVKHANAICREIGDALSAEYVLYIKQHHLASRSEQSGAKELLAKIYYPAQKRKMERLRALSPPSNDEKQVAAILKATQEGINKADVHPLNFFTGDTWDNRIFDEAAKLDEAYGLRECAAN